MRTHRIKITLSLVCALALFVATSMSGNAVAQVHFNGQDLSAGTALRADGTAERADGTLVYLESGELWRARLWTNTSVGSGTSQVRYSHWSNLTPLGEQLNRPSTISDTTNSGYADMHRTTRSTELAGFTYVRPNANGGPANARHAGVIDFGVTRDAFWTTVYTIADVAVSGAGLNALQGLAPGTHGSLPIQQMWGNQTRQQGIANFLKGFDSSHGFIDNFVVRGNANTLGTGTNSIHGVFASTAELYGNAHLNREGGMFDQMRARGYDAGTNYREGGLMHMDRLGGGVIGQSGGYYFDEGGQFIMDVHGVIQRAESTRGQSGHNFVTGSQVAFDDWNQYGLVMTGADLIAYTTFFRAFGDSADNVLFGNFSVLGEFTGLLINGNWIDASLFTMFDAMYTGTESRLINRGVLGDYAFMLDLNNIDASFWNVDGYNDVSFMVRTMSAWELDIIANTTYAREMGVNFFSAGIGFGAGGDRLDNVVPEPATMALIGLGLAGLGYARVRRNRRDAKNAAAAA